MHTSYFYLDMSLPYSNFAYIHTPIIFLSLCVIIFLSLCVYIYVYVYIHLCIMRIYVHAYIYSCPTLGGAHTLIHTVHTYIRICVYDTIHIYVYLYMILYICIHAYIHTHPRTPALIPKKEGAQSEKKVKVPCVFGCLDADTHTFNKCALYKVICILYTTRLRTRYIQVCTTTL